MLVPDSLGSHGCCIKKTASGRPRSVMTHKLGVFGEGSGEALFAKRTSPENVPSLALKQDCGIA
jgi:hypothetical protein